MAEVKVERPKTLARQETGLGRVGDFFEPMFPGRFFGLTPFARNPWAFMREFTEDWDRAFRGVTPGVEAWTPAVDVQRCNGDLVVKAELPGLKKEEVKVEMTDTALIIEGERKREHKEDHQGYHRYERSYGKFYRAIPLPEGAKADLAKAELTEGVLKISIPVPEVKKNIREVKVEEPAPGKKPVAA